jgi:putative ABC transport system substrate-binding protein
MRLIAAAAIASPNAVLGQQTNRVPLIGVLYGGSKGDPQSQAAHQALQQGLREQGLSDGRNIRIDYRWGSANSDQISRNAKELVELNPNLIVASTTPVVAAVLQQTRTIPIVFLLVADPVGQGFITSLARPGGNITGFTPYEFSLGGKWLEILKDVAPQITRVALLFSPDTVAYAGFVHLIEETASSVAVQPIEAPVRGPADMENAIKAFAQEPNGGMIVIPDFSTAVHRQRLLQLAAEYRLPAVYGFRYFATDGGLVSYGPDSIDPYRRAATYIDRILKGENPSELPVQAPTKLELVINLKTAKALGIEVPGSLLARADEVIE